MDDLGVKPTIFGNIQITKDNHGKVSKKEPSKVRTGVIFSTIRKREMKWTDPFEKWKKGHWFFRVFFGDEILPSYVGIILTYCIIRIRIPINQPV